MQRLFTTNDANNTQQNTPNFKIVNISIEYGYTSSVMGCKIKFASENDLDKFRRSQPFQIFRMVQQATKSSDDTLSMWANQQEWDSLFQLLTEISRVDATIGSDAIRQFDLARKELDVKEIYSLSQICKGWNVHSSIRGDSKAVNPNQDAKLLSIEVNSRIISIPDMSWSEYCDYERAEYGLFCKMKFATKELAEAHQKKFASHHDVKFDDYDANTIIHGPRSCLTYFRRELMEYSHEYKQSNITEQASKSIGARTMFAQPTKRTISLEVPYITDHEAHPKPTEKQLTELRHKCSQIATRQEAVISDAITTLKLKENQKFRIYPFENLSPHLDAPEKDADKEPSFNGQILNSRSI